MSREFLFREMVYFSIKMDSKVKEQTKSIYSFLSCLDGHEIRPNRPGSPWLLGIIILPPSQRLSSSL